MTPRNPLHQFTVARRARRHACRERVLEVGVCQSGAPLVFPCPSGDPQHVLITGTTGSGKSVLMRVWIGAVAGLDDVAIIGLDPKRTALGLWSPRFTYVAKTIAECTRTLVWLYTENERRLDVMEAAGVDAWHPDLGGPFIEVAIDELVQVSALDGAGLANLLVSDETPVPASFNVAANRVNGTNSTRSKAQTRALSDAMTAASKNQKAQGIFLSYLARICRSSGIRILAATQYPMSDVVDPQVRANLDLRIMLRVTSQEMVKVCLADGRNQDITPDSISLDERGGCWVAGHGGRPIRARSFLAETAHGRAQAEQTAHLRWPIENVFVGQGLTDANVFGTAGVVGAEALTVPEPQAEGGQEPTALPQPVLLNTGSSLS